MSLGKVCPKFRENKNDARKNKKKGKVRKQVIQRKSWGILADATFPRGGQRRGT